MRRLLGLVMIAALASPAHALCVRTVLKPLVITADVTTSSGGIVVGTEIGTGSDKDLDPAQPSWRFKTKTGSVKPVIVELAPGLVAYQLPDKVDGGELFDGKATIAKIARSATAVPKLAAPAPKKITYKLIPGRRGDSEQTMAYFASVPSQAVALVVVDAKTMKPRSYGVVQEGAVDISVYGRGRCSALPNGTVPSVKGDKVILRWVDKSGAVSADSKPITIVKA